MEWAGLWFLRGIFCGGGKCGGLRLGLVWFEEVG